MKIHIFLKGIGISVIITILLEVSFYIMIMAYSLYFMKLSITTELPWQKCNPEWASSNCVDDFDPSVFTFNSCNANLTMFKCTDKASINFGRCFNATKYSGNDCDSFLQNTSFAFWKSSFPSQDYWTKVVLQKSSSIDEPGKPVWQLVLALFAAYLIIYLMLIGGKKISGKLVWFTALFPYAMMLILGIRGWMLPGADIGIKYYLIPNWSKLGEIEVWRDAATQIFFTLAVGFGGMNTLASYNKFNHNILRDAFTIPLANCFTSFFAGFVIFAYMGYLSHITGQDIDNIVQAGQGLVFVVYPYAMTTVAGGPFWAFMFFFMVTLLGIDSSLAQFEVLLSTVLDTFPKLRSTKKKRFITVSAIFILYFIISIRFTFNSGTYWIELFNTNIGSWALLVNGLSFCLTVTCFYGLKNMRTDIKCMLGSKAPNWTFYIWYGLWGFVTPTIIIVIIVKSISKIKVQTLGDYVFPEWTLAFGQIFNATITSGMIIYAIYAIIHAISKRKSIKSLFQPDFEAFIPRNESDQIAVAIARGHNTTHYTPIKRINLEQ